MLLKDISVYYYGCEYYTSALYTEQSVAFKTFSGIVQFSGINGKSECSSILCNLRGVVIQSFVSGGGGGYVDACRTCEVVSR